MGDMTTTKLRDQCAACPWRNLAAMRVGQPFERRAVAYAEAGHLDEFVCHVRCGPCDGPRIALHEPRRQEATT